MSVTFTAVISILTVASHIVLAILVVSLILRHKVAKWVGQHALLLAFFTALLATLLSLYFSEIIGFEPCRLCWYQRIFLFPQVAMLGLAWWYRDMFIRIYSVALSVIGVAIAAYHTVIQHTGHSVLPCSAENILCTQRLVFEYGYITIPVMSLTIFLYLVFFMVASKQGE
ncbi:MAG: disulfide bond formation protein B [bacterium]|nr:disulfide bond formation protein B [bacterium]